MRVAYSLMLPSGMVIEMGSRGFFAISSSYFFLSRSKLRDGNSQHHKRATHRHAHGNRTGPIHVKAVLQEVGRRAHLDSALGVSAALLLVLLAADGDLLDALGDRVYCLLRRFHSLEQLGGSAVVFCSFGREAAGRSRKTVRVGGVEYRSTPPKYSGGQNTARDFS